VQDFVAVQSDIVRDNLRQMIDTNKRVAEVSVRFANSSVQLGWENHEARKSAGADLPLTSPFR
jgi:hypothetical protein